MTLKQLGRSRRRIARKAQNTTNKIKANRLWLRHQLICDEIDKIEGIELDKWTFSLSAGLILQ